MSGFLFRTALMLTQTNCITCQWSDGIHLQATPHGEGIHLIALQEGANIMDKIFDDVEQCERFMKEYGVPGYGWNISQEDSNCIVIHG